MERSCFLFGHGDSPAYIMPILEQAIEEEILQGTRVFYVGAHGNFDRFATAALQAVKQRHRTITLMLVLPHHPAEKPVLLPSGFDGTFLPPLEGVPRRFALLRANQYMLRFVHSIVCCVNHPGNSQALLEMALKRARKEHLRITNLAEKTRP